MASKSIEITATLISVTRTRNSVNGNPTWILHTDQGDLVTQSDASIGYEVDNHTGGRDDWTGRTVVFTATPARRVWAWRLA
jgi:hypothetical protein